jgi:hypothetical protein
VVFRCAVPLEVLRRERHFARIRFELPFTVRPCDLDPHNSDQRSLGAMIGWICITKESTATAPKILDATSEQTTFIKAPPAVEAHFNAGLPSTTSGAVDLIADASKPVPEGSHKGLRLPREKRPRIQPKNDRESSGRVARHSKIRRDRS